MIQRKQTLWMLLALVVSIVCLSTPIARLEPMGMGTGDSMYNLWIQLAGGTHDYSVWPLFALLLITCPLQICAILLYGNRPLQSRICLLNMLLYVVWYVVFAVQTRIGGNEVSFHPTLSACLPALATILSFMAYKGIQHDERLVRAADRIR